MTTCSVIIKAEKEHNAADNRGLYYEASLAG